MEIGRNKLFVALGALFILGIVLSVSNAYCAVNMGHVFAPLLYGIALAALATGAAIALLFQWKIDRLQFEKIIGVLPEDERKVLKVLIEKKSISQSELRYQSGLSKVKVSRIIAKLSKRGIVDKKNYGNTNLIILKVS